MVKVTAIAYNEIYQMETFTDTETQSKLYTLIVGDCDQPILNCKRWKKAMLPHLVLIASHLVKWMNQMYVSVAVLNIMTTYQCLPCWICRTLFQQQWDKNSGLIPTIVWLFCSSWYDTNFNPICTNLVHCNENQFFVKIILILGWNA